MPAISVIIPAYNAQRTIAETLESLFAQTFQDFEAIVIDDGSTDETAAIVGQFTDPRLKLFSFENAGVSVARNRGIVASAGDCIAFLDADDLWTPEKLERQFAALQAHPEAGVAYSWNLFIDEAGHFIGKQTPVYFEGNVYGELLVQDFLVCGSTILVRREAIEATGEFDSELKNYQAVDYWRRLARYWSFVLVPEHQIIRRIVSGSLSADLKRHETFMMMAIEKSFDDAPAEYQPLKNKSIAYHYQHLAHKYLERELESDGIRMAGAKLWTAIRHYPGLLGDRHMQRTIRNWLLLSIFGVQGFERLTNAYKRMKPGSSAVGATNSGKS